MVGERARSTGPDILFFFSFFATCRLPRMWQTSWPFPPPLTSRSHRGVVDDDDKRQSLDPPRWVSQLEPSQRLSLCERIIFGSALDALPEVLSSPIMADSQGRRRKRDRRYRQLRS